jgi:hypothetical protein
MPGEIVELKPKRKHIRTLAQLLTLDSLDQRSGAAKRFRAITSGIEADIGGAPSTIQKHLCAAFASSVLTVEHLSAQMALGQPVDLAALAAAVSALVRLSNKLGVKRTRDHLTPSLDAYLRTKAEPTE